MLLVRGNFLDHDHTNCLHRPNLLLYSVPRLDAVAQLDVKPQDGHDGAGTTAGKSSAFMEVIRKTAAASARTAKRTGLIASMMAQRELTPLSPRGRAVKVSGEERRTAIDLCEAHRKTKFGVRRKATRLESWGRE